MIADLKQVNEKIDLSTGEVLPFIKKGSKLKLHHSSSDSRSISRNQRYSLQNISASLLPSQRVSKCLRTNISSSVDVNRCKHTDGTHSASYVGLMQCGSVWSCPVCSAKIAEKRSRELREAFEIAKNKKLNVSHVTFTFPHSKFDSLSENLDLFLDAFKRFWDSVPMRHFKNEYRLIGKIRALEVNYSEKNGFHPHIHLLCFTEFKLEHLKSLEAYFLESWNDKLSRVGLSKANSHGISIQNGDNAGEYINKFADDTKLTKTGDVVTWDMADELTKLNTKSGRSGSLTPFDFLRIIDSPSSYGFSKSDSLKFKSLFIEYAKCFYGKSQLDWGRGSLNLRKNLGMDNEISDSEILDTKEDLEIVSTITLPIFAWKKLKPTSKNNDLRSTFLTVFENQGSDCAYTFLKNTCFRHMSQNLFNVLIVNYKKLKE